MSGEGGGDSGGAGSVQHVSDTVGLDGVRGVAIGMLLPCASHTRMHHAPPDKQPIIRRSKIP